MIIKNISLLVTQNSSRDILENKSILIIDGFIKKIDTFISDSENNDDVIIDAQNCVLIPGLINGHTHIGMQKLRGVCDDEELNVWLSKVMAIEDKLTFDDIYKYSKKAISEMYMTGTTCFNEMYAPIEPIVKATKELGIRAIISLGFSNKFSEDAFFKLKQTCEQDDFVKSRFNKLVNVEVAPHSIYLCPKDILVKAKDVSKKLGVTNTIHLAETRKERYDCMEQHNNLTPTEYLDKLNFLSKNTILIHNVWLTKEDLDLIKKSDAKLIHCPTSNMKLSGGGVMPLTEAWERSIVCGLGTDSVASNNNLDMFEEMKICSLLHKHHTWDPTAANTQKVFDMATIDGAKCLNLDSIIGSIEIGKKADLVLLKRGVQLEPFTKERIISHLVFSTPSRLVYKTIIDGKIVYES